MSFVRPFRNSGHSALFSKFIDYRLVGDLLFAAIGDIRTQQFEESDDDFYLYCRNSRPD
jgi:hypothetical protein